MSDVVVSNVFREATQGSASDTPGATAPKAPASTAAKPDSGVRSWSKSKAIAVMRIGNLCNGLCLALFAIVVFIMPDGSLTPSFSTITLSAYTCFLGLLMCCVEINISFMNKRMRNNCGFMFSYLGRAVFVFFSGSMALALVQPDSKVAYLYVIGGLTCINALFNCFVIFLHPSFQKGEVTALDDPSGRSSTAEDNVRQYLQDHPELVARAVSGGITAGARATNAMRAAELADRQARVTTMSNPFQTSITASAYDQPIPVVIPPVNAPVTAPVAAVPLGYNGATGSMMAAAVPASRTPVATLQRTESEMANPFS